MKRFTTIEMRIEVTQVNEGLLVRMKGRCEGTWNEVPIRNGEHKVDKAARECNAEQRKNSAQDRLWSNEFYREYVFPDRESLDKFYEILTSES